MKDSFTIWGFKFNKKNSLYFLIFAVLFVTIFLVLDFAFKVNVSWYGVIIGFGFLIAIMFYTKLSEYRGLPEDFAYDLIWWVFPLSIIGARTFYVVCSLDEFSSFYEMIALWNGGMSIIGGIIGGLLGVIICCLIKKKNIICAIDVIAPPLILAQAIGRWGNFINQEVYGLEVTNKALQWFPFAVHITEYGENSWHLATFFYESVLNLIGFFILVIILRKVKLKGIVSSSYLFFYGVVRYFLEGLRVEGYVLNFPGTNIPSSRMFSLIFAIVGVIGICVCLTLHFRKEKLTAQADIKDDKIKNETESKNLKKKEKNNKAIEEKNREISKNKNKENNENVENTKAKTNKKTKMKNGDNPKVNQVENKCLDN